MDWLTTLRNSPITKIILMILTLILGGTASYQAYESYHAAPEGEFMAEGDAPSTVGWIIATVISAVGAFVSGPTGQAYIQKLNSKYRGAITASKDPNVQFVAEFQAWDFLQQGHKEDVPYQNNIAAVGQDLIRMKSTAKV